MILGRNWVEALATSALMQAKKYDVCPEYFYCMRPIVDGRNIHWNFDQYKTVIRDNDRVTGIHVFEPDKAIRKKSSTLIAWAEIYGIARDLLDREHDLAEEAILSIELERLFTLVDRYSTDGSKGGRELDYPALLEYLRPAIEEIMEVRGKCSFTDLKKWLKRNAKGQETGIDDCDYVLYSEEDPETKLETKPYLTWTNGKVKRQEIKVSSLEKTYFKESKK